MKTRLSVLREKTKGYPQILKPTSNPILPEDPSSLPISTISRLLFQFTEIYRWAVQTHSRKKAELKLRKAALDNEIRLKQVGSTKKVSLAQVEREVKAEHPETLENLDLLEAEIIVLEGVVTSYQAGREALSREITIRTRD